MAKSGKSQFAILGMLALLKQSSGYNLKKHIESTTHNFWKETFSSIYPVLESLEQQKLIIKIDEAPENERQRNIYTLTKKGHKILENWLIQPAENIQIRNEFLLKLFFGNLIPVDITIQHLKDYKKKLRTYLSSYQAIKKDLSILDSSEKLYGSFTLDHGIEMVLASLTWCDTTIKKLQAQQNKNL